MKILLVGNYPPDAQQSMLRFGELMARSLAARGVETMVAQPEVRWRRLRPRGGAAKWLGYVDKYFVFPRALRRAAAAANLVHVVDHSNAVYVPTHARVPWVVTCHDLLAVRGALGEDTDCPASTLGRRLQRSIVAGLSRAQAVACDSTSTFDDLQRLVPRTRGQERRVILLGANHPYRRLDPAEAWRRLDTLGGVPWTEPFLLHVGSNLGRKNKAGVVRVLGALRSRWKGNLVFCGGELTPELRAEAEASGVSGRVFAVLAPTNEQLEAIYSRAEALIFPSKCEGFGWPVVEAQACGCPVICSDRTSLPEVAGEAGLVFALHDVAGMAEAVLRLREAGFRTGVIQAGLANTSRFTAARMIDEYLEFYARTPGGRLA